MWTAFPSSDYYGPSAPPQGHQPTACLPVLVPDARGGGRPWGGSHVHHVPVGRIGAQLFRCGLATATPQAFAVASWSATLSDVGVVSPHTCREDVHRCPAHIHQVGAGSQLERVQTLVHFRYTSLPCSPDPGRLAVPARPVFVWAASHPPERLLGQAALSFIGLLRQPDEVGLSPPLVTWRLMAHGVDGEEVRREDARGLGAEELGPGGTPAWCRTESVAAQHAADRARRQAVDSHGGANRLDVRFHQGR
jgi:hypothetical protein